MMTIEIDHTTPQYCPLSHRLQLSNFVDPLLQGWQILKAIALNSHAQVVAQDAQKVPRSHAAERPLGPDRADASQ